MNWIILLLFANSWYSGVILIRHLLDGGEFIRKGHKIKKKKNFNSIEGCLLDKEAFINWKLAFIRSFMTLQ